MLRITFICALLPFGLFPSRLGMAVTPSLIEGLPGGFVPGTPFGFQVRLPAITNLGSYNIDIVLESSIGVAGTDFFFDVAGTEPAVTNYVFPSSSNFFDAVNVDAPMRHRISLTDFNLAGLNVAPDANDRVADVKVQTAPTFSGSLSVFVDTPLLILDTPNITPTPVQGFSAIQAAIAAAGPVDLMPVPEPSTVLLAAMLLAILSFASKSPTRL